jgi:microcystin-dependent protein
VSRNGRTIEGLAEDLIVDIGNASIDLIYDGTTWQVYTQVGAKGGSSGGPSGSVIYHAGSSAPEGYIKANGASLSTSTYSDLFAAIGYTFGGSGGSFNVPDLRGEFIRGWDDSRGVDSGRGFGSFQSDDLGSHTHSAYGGFSNVWFSAYARSGEWANERYFSSSSYQTGSTGGADTRPRNRALLACIKT